MKSNVYNKEASYSIAWIRMFAGAFYDKLQ